MRGVGRPLSDQPAKSTSFMLKLLLNHITFAGRRSPCTMSLWCSPHNALHTCRSQPHTAFHHTAFTAFKHLVYTTLQAWNQVLGWCEVQLHELAQPVELLMDLFSALQHMVAQQQTADRESCKVLIRKATPKVIVGTVSTANVRAHV